jgi:peptidyl-prolyl cis-trans isomerase SurA
MNKVHKTMLLFFAFTFAGNLFAQVRLIDKVVATVGDRMIMLSDVQQQKLQMIQNKIPVNDKTDCFILEELIFQRLLLHQADIDSIEVSDDQVEAELNNRITYYKRLLEQYGKTLEEEYGMSETLIKEEFRISVKERLLAESMEGKITSDVIVSPRDIREYFKSIPADSLPKINMQVEYSHLVLYPEVTKEAEADALMKLTESKAGVMSGEHSFSFYATLYSQDPGSATKGGDFGCVSKGMFVPEFDAMAFALKPGEVSEPFKTQYGWHILQLKERRGETYCGSHILVIPKVGYEQIEKTRIKLDSIAGQIRDGKISFTDAARKFSMDEASKQNGGKVYNTQYGMFKWDVADMERDRAMTLDQMTVGQVSPVAAYFDEEGKQALSIMQLNVRHRPHIANLDDDYPLFQQAATADKKQKVTENWFKTKAKTTYVQVNEEYAGCPMLFNEKDNQ